MTAPAAPFAPCPFDDGTSRHDASINNDSGYDSDGAHGWWVHCRCGARGPEARDAFEALAAWNRRSTSTEATT